MTYPIHTPADAPEAARPSLEAAGKAFGFVPNLLGVMSAAPPLLQGYLALAQLFDQTSFSPTERQIVLLAVSAVNGCEYCVSAHTAIAGMQKVPDDVIGAIRQGEPIDDARLEALRRFAESVVMTRGLPDPVATEAFLSAGFARSQVLEVVLGVGMKTLSNYTNHIAETPLDDAFAPVAWHSHKAA